MLGGDTFILVRRGDILFLNKDQFRQLVGILTLVEPVVLLWKLF